LPNRFYWPAQIVASVGRLATDQNSIRF
jgi:hypothetical protein